MLTHNLILIYRNILSSKGTFVINLAGLSLGLAGTLLIYLWAADEIGVDKFHTEKDRLFQVMVNNSVADKIETSKSTPIILGETLKQEVPEVEEMATTVGGIDLTMSVRSNHIMQRGIVSSEHLFELFSFRLLKGSAERVLSDKKAIVISERLAIALFGNANTAFGKTLSWQFPGLEGDAIVTGVFENIGLNSSVQFDFVLPLALYIDLTGETGWNEFSASTFLLLKSKTDHEAVNAKVHDLIQRKKQNSKMTVFIREFSSTYLHDKYENGKPAGGRIEYVGLFSSVAVFILILACINFVNLSTARASRRTKEVGVKKTVGAARRTLVVQFLGESFLLTFVSLAIAILIVDLLMPSFNTITGKELTFFFDGKLLTVVFAIFLVTGLMAGVYPALFLSGLNPGMILKGTSGVYNSSVNSLIARKALIVFQFSIAIIFIVVVWIVNQQIEFIQARDLGYQRKNVIHIKPEGRIASSLASYLKELNKIPGVSSASSISRTIVGSKSSTIGFFDWEGRDQKEVIPFEVINCNYGLIETLGISMADGRSFSEEHSLDTASIIINETAVAAMRLKDPVGKRFNVWGKNYTIIGVTKDFHFESLHQTVTPLFFTVAPDNVDHVVVRIEAGQNHEALLAIESFTKKFNPEYTFSFSFLDSEVQGLYTAERRVATLSRCFGFLAVVISGLGLIGLTTFTAQRRIKEIGIRKVLGSGQWRIIWLLSSDFVKIVLIASIIALPLSYMYVSQWLSNFAFRIALSWWYFPLAGLIALFIAVLTAGFQALRASAVNPIHCLKVE